MIKKGLGQIQMSGNRKNRGPGPVSRRLGRASGGCSSVLSSSRNSSEDDTRPVEKERDGLVRRLQSQVKDLRGKLRLLEESVQTKDQYMGTMARDRDRATGEMRRLEKSNRQLRKQLTEERNHYMAEKKKFCGEMARYKRRLQEVGPRGVGEKGDTGEVDNPRTLKSDVRINKTGSGDSIGLYNCRDHLLQMVALRTENAKLRAIINERDERNHELCLRFLRMKHSKNDLRTRFHNLENEYLQVITNLMDKIDEAREEFNFIIDQKFKVPLPPTNDRYLKMVQQNSKIAIENVSLRMELQSLKNEIPKLPVGSRNRVDKIDDDSSKKRVYFGERTTDTDSNHMSKMSTTDPSAGSVKSSESMVGCGAQYQNDKNPGKTSRDPLFTEDILNKIFRRVDLGSSAGSEEVNGRAKPDNEVRQKSKELIVWSNKAMGKRYIACSINSKKFHDVTEYSRSRLTKEDRCRKTKTRYTESKDRARFHSDRDRIGDSLKVKPSSRNSRDGLEMKSPRRFRWENDKQQIVIRDNCGLEENLDTDLDTSHNSDCENLASVKSKQEPDQTVEEHRNWPKTKDSEKDAKNRNSVSLHDELMEATKSLSQTNDQFWRRELNLHTMISKSDLSSRTYCLGSNPPLNDISGKNPVMSAKEIVPQKDHSEDDTTTRAEQLRTTSPTYRSTGTDPIPQTNQCSEVLRFLMPPTTIESNQSLLSDEAKSTPMTSNREHHQPNSASNIVLPWPNRPSSSSTMDLADSSVTRGNELTSRTLSAPALLESQWLDTLKMCEMKDCGTNT